MLQNGPFINFWGKTCKDLQGKLRSCTQQICKFRHKTKIFCNTFVFATQERNYSMRFPSKKSSNINWSTSKQIKRLIKTHTKRKRREKREEKWQANFFTRRRTKNYFYKRKLWKLERLRFVSCWKVSFFFLILSEGFVCFHKLFLLLIFSSPRSTIFASNSHSMCMQGRRSIWWIFFNTHLANLFLFNRTSVSKVNFRMHNAINISQYTKLIENQESSH